MTAAEHHQQQLEAQQWLEEMISYNEKISVTHSLIINQIRYFRDEIPSGHEKEAVIDRLIELLNEYEDLNKKMRSL
jgi:hypothetical protein